MEQDVPVAFLLSVSICTEAQADELVYRLNCRLDVRRSIPAFRPALGPTQLHVQWVPWSFPGR